MLLTDLQKEKTDKILSIFQNSGNNPPIKVEFKAPTGSGKTLMASAVIAGMINRIADKKLLFIIATVSTSDLPYFFEKKLNQYKEDLEYSNFEAEYIQSPSSSKENKNQDMQVQIRPEQNKVYIFGKATFGKGRIFTEQNVIADFVQECKQQGYSIVYIRDEAHIGDGAVSKSDMKTFEGLMSENAEYILRMTATFNKRDTQTPRVELTEKELKDPDKNNGKWLIKCTPRHLRNEAITDKEILTQAIKDFRQVQQEYQSLNIGIRPAMLIQVDNNPTSNPERSKAFAETLEMAKTLLKESGLSWVQYFGDNDKDFSNVDNKDFTLDKITRNNDTTDCIIFKIGPATGWDIPRACMLVQLRNVCSKTLHIQTIGRIKRNPYPGLAKNDITDKYYIYTNEKKGKDKEYSVFDYKVKEAYKDELFAVIKHKQRQDDTVQQEMLKNKIIDFLKENSNAILTRISESFPQGKNEYLETQNKVIIKNPILLLKFIKARQNCLSPIQKQAINAALKSYTEIEDLASVKKETMHIILLANFLNHIKKIAKAAAEQSVSYEIMEEKIEPDAYCSIVEDSGNKSYQTGKNYLFDIKKNGQDINAQILDSNNEIAVFSTINNYIQFIGGIKVWAKNQRSGNICGDYLGHDNAKHKSYFDFIIKYENEVMLYIEVKGEPDINPEKTECLTASYSKYFETKKGQSELFDKIVVICIAKVNSSKQITPKLFYDKEKIKKDFKKGETFENILKELGKL